ncbi:MAG TPA: glycosyltransferase [Noviherbaspirillum sp.]|nr:glycosyltransferase [Noviherbaspirillum sp.]
MNSPVRILWLLNHTTLRRFEVAQLRALGITEVYCPKRFPYDEGNLSASVDESLDATLSIPALDLQVLNEQNWYESPSTEAWAIANLHFSIAVIGFFPRQIEACVQHFKGSLVLRVFGLAKGYSYTRLLGEELGPPFIDKLRAMGNRFWFGTGYEHLEEVEEGLLRNRACFLPVGLDGEVAPDNWRGTDKRIFFVCPRIETSPYFKAIYQAFKKDFSGLDYVIGGAQPVKVADSKVLGFVPREVHERNMRELRVMFYHSTEPNHIHYHPFEAIRAGMPLVYMAGGMLDRMGGEQLPGRCTSIAQAREKIRRILDDDRNLIDAIRRSQLKLLEPMKPENCIAAWQAGFRRILNSLSTNNVVPLVRKHRIALIVPTGYRGGSLRGAKLLAQAIEAGGLQAGRKVDVVFGHLDDEDIYTEEEFADLPPSVRRRPFKWQVLPADEARRALAYAGLPQETEAPCYQVPDDGIRHFSDCDLWIIVSDRLDHPLLPLRPYIVMVYDYLQRYEGFLPQTVNRRFIHVAHRASRVFVTTEFTRQDALQFAGLPSRKVKKLPMLAPDFSARRSAAADRRQGYFLWTTNLSQHKNHENAVKALQLYYEELGGVLPCRVTGVETDALLKSNLPHLKPLRALVSHSPVLRKNLQLLGELPERAYQSLLAGSEFLWHPARIDNGTFSVIEAAHLGVPSLSSDYPAMREIDAQFGLQLAWMDPRDPQDMARKLKAMERLAEERRAVLPSQQRLASQSLAALAGAYWQAVEECL